ncbi:MAG: LysM peptidoglycan-binding domain-containing protein [Clostridia bacterium]|nr:LysM peptidoglycan-binding domain-containing protein [bacterium]
MKIVNVKKFIRTMSILVILILIIILFSNKTYSKVDTKYKEESIILGDTLWSISQEEAKSNKYFENKDIREIVSEIKRINKLDNLDLREGQKLLIPTY